MTKTMNHTNCTHPATKAGRAACRRMHAAQETERRALLAEVKEGYYNGTLDLEEIAGHLIRLAPAAAQAYYAGADPDEVMDLAR